MESFPMPPYTEKIWSHSSLLPPPTSNLPARHLTEKQVSTMHHKELPQPLPGA
jgi:hypothetical protein